MNTSLKWIKDLVPGLDCTPQEYMDAMTLSGSKVEGYENMDEDLDKIVIGQVKALRKHPDAVKTCDLPGRYRNGDNTDCDRCSECD